MTERRQLRLGAFMRPVSIRTAWWRYPGAYPDANFNFRHIARFAQTLERGKFDAFFMADHLALLNMPMNALKRSATTTSFDPLTLLPALAVVTERLGLIATASTTFNDPYHIARKFASLDHISNGRAGWNLVTTSNPEAALNFGLEQHVEHGERYRKAREFYDVVTGLWDSWADDAFIRDVESGIYFDPDRMHVLNHKGPYFSVRGPLNIARPVQGWPVIVQAGVAVRPGPPAAGDPRDQPKQKRTPTGGRPGEARKSDGAPTRPDRRRLRRAIVHRNAKDHRRPDGGMAVHRCLRRLQCDVPVCPRRSGRLRRDGGPCNAAVCSVRNTKAGHCGRTWGCQDQPTRSSLRDKQAAVVRA
jgi:hypothetical protein